MDDAPVGHLLTDADGLLLDANPAVLRWLGTDPTRLLRAVRFADLLPPGQRVVWQTHHLAELERTGRIGGVALDLRGAEATTAVLATASLIPAESGRPLIGITLVDATERRSYERDLLAARRLAEDAERRLRLLQRITEDCATSTTAVGLMRSLASTLAEGLVADAVTTWLADRATGLELHLVAGQDAPSAAPAVLRAALPDRSYLSLVRGEVVLATDGTRTTELFGRLGGRALAGIAIPFRHNGQCLGAGVALFSHEWRGDARDVLDLAHAGSLVGQSLERARLQDVLRDLATRDALTGLANRRTLVHRLAEALQRSARRHTPVSLVFVDLDGFKGVNDTHGHAAGDAALTEAAARLQSAVRDVDLVARLGGDEFVVLCEDGGTDSAAQIAHRIHDSLRHPFEHDGQPITLAASTGIATHEPGSGPGSPEDLLSRADRAMYVAKQARR